MRSEISEFSYGFAISAELRDLFWPLVVEAPFFPTLREETELGWDVRFPVLGSPLFIQFKVAEALTRGNASEWPYYNATYYRFPLHRLSKSDQHNRLRNLGSIEPFVFYVAPRFHRLEEFNESYFAASAITDSVWIPTVSLPIISDDQQHHVAYRTGFDVLFSSPEPERIRGTFDGEHWKAFLTDEVQQRKRQIAFEDFGRLRSVLLGVLRRMQVSNLPEFPAPFAEGFQVFKDIAYLSRTFFGAEFLLIHERQKQA